MKIPKKRGKLQKTKLKKWEIVITKETKKLTHLNVRKKEGVARVSEKIVVRACARSANKHSRSANNRGGSRITVYTPGCRLRFPNVLT